MKKILLGLAEGYKEMKMMTKSKQMRTVMHPFLSMMKMSEYLDHRSYPVDKWVEFGSFDNLVSLFSLMLLKPAP